MAEFSDNSVSATSGRRRPQFEALLTAVERGEVEAIVAWSLDRLSRTARDRLKLVEVCRDAGVVIALVRGSDMDPTTPAGRLVLGVLGEVAQAETDIKSERQQRAQEQAAKAGRRVGGRWPFGYTRDGLELQLEEAESIRCGYALALDGVPLAEIARRWNAEGHRTSQLGWRSGEFGLWRHDGVRRVLLNPRNAGLRQYRGEIVALAEWPRIVDEETWRAVVALLGEPARRCGTPGAVQLLTGLATCAVCGLLVHGGGASHGKPIYRCCSNKHVNRLAEPVDAYVSSLIVARLSRPDARELLHAKVGDRPNVAVLREESSRLRARLEEIAVEFAADTDVTPAMVRTMTAAVRARLAANDAQLADAGRVSLLGPLVGAEDVRAAWESLDPAGRNDRRRQVVAVLLSVGLHGVGRGTRTFRPDTVGLDWLT